MTTTQTDAIMALADRYAFHIPGSQHSDEARAVLLAALQEQAPKRLWGMAGFNPPLPNVGEKYTSIHEDDLGDHVTVTGIANASSPNIAYVFLSWDDGHYGERAIDEFWQEYMMVQTNDQAREGEADCRIEQLKALGVYNESTKAELARVQAVAEWQGSADGGKSWRRIDKPRGESIESRVAYLRNMTNSQGRPIYLIRALYTPPQPAAQQRGTCTWTIAAGQQYLKENEK